MNCVSAPFLLFFDNSSLSSPPLHLGEDCFPVTNEQVDVTETGLTQADDSLELRQIILGTVLAAFAAFTVAGNMLVMVAVACEPSLRNNVTNYFIVSLAVADLLIGAVVMPFSIVLEVHDGWWPFGDDWCDIWHSLDVLASTASILNLSVIALDRYWAITDPISYPTRMSGGRAGVFIGLVWVCSAAISFPAIVWWRYTAASRPPQLPFTCAFTEDSAYLILSSLVSFYAPVSVILYAYYRIYAAAAAQLRCIERGSKVMATGSVSCRDRTGNCREMTTLRIHRGGGSASGSGSIVGRRMLTNASASSHSQQRTLQQSSPLIDESRRGTNASQSPSTTPRRWNTFSVCRQKLSRVSRERKAAKTLGIVMGVFCACWVPFFVTNLLYGACRHLGCVQHAEILFRVFTWLGYINSAMNPVIYACSLRDFRRAFARQLVCIGCRCCTTVRLTAGHNYPPSMSSSAYVQYRAGGEHQCFASTSFSTN